MVVVIMIIAVVDLSIVFLKMDAMQAQQQEDYTASKPWLTCLVVNKGDKNKCLDLTGSIILNEPTILSALFMVAVWLLPEDIAETPC